MSTHASFLTTQTRSKHGPTLRARFALLPFITSRPLRLPYAHNIPLAGVTQLESCLPRSEFRGDARTSGLTLVVFHRMPLAVPRVPCRCAGPLLPCRRWPSPYNKRIGAYPRRCGVYPSPGLSQLLPSGIELRGCTIRFMLRPAALAGPPDWVRPALCTSRHGTLSGQVQPVCYHTNPPPA